MIVASWNEKFMSWKNTLANDCSLVGWKVHDLKKNCKPLLPQETKSSSVEKKPVQIIGASSDKTNIRVEKTVIVSVTEFVFKSMPDIFDLIQNVMDLPVGFTCGIFVWPFYRQWHSTLLWQIDAGSLTCAKMWVHAVRCTKGAQAQTSLHKSWLGGDSKTVLHPASPGDRTPVLWIRSLTLYHSAASPVRNWIRFVPVLDHGQFFISRSADRYNDQCKEL